MHWTWPFLYSKIPFSIFFNWVISTIRKGDVIVFVFVFLSIYKILPKYSTLVDLCLSLFFYFQKVSLILLYFQCSLIGREIYICFDSLVTIPALCPKFPSGLVCCAIIKMVVNYFSLKTTTTRTITKIYVLYSLEHTFLFQKIFCDFLFPTAL